MNTVETLKTVIEKYELNDPVPLSARLAMEKSRKDNLVKILKGETSHTILISSAVSFFFWIKKFGISISIAKSTAAVISALIIGLSVITVAGVYTSRLFMYHITHESPDIITPVMDQGIAVKPEDMAVQEMEEYSVAVSPVEMDDVSAEKLSVYRKKMILELKSLRGMRAAIDLNRLDEYHTAGKILSITIIMLNEEAQRSGVNPLYRVSAKIINSSNSQVMMHTSVTAADEKDILNSLRMLAEKISPRL